MPFGPPPPKDCPHAPYHGGCAYPECPADCIGRKNILPPENKGETDAEGEKPRIQSLIHRCQVGAPRCALLGMRAVRASISALAAKNEKSVCYHSRAGGNSAAALFDMVRQ